jgi:hypothetical protein
MTAIPSKSSLLELQLYEKGRCVYLTMIIVTCMMRSRLCQKRCLLSHLFILRLSGCLNAVALAVSTIVPCIEKVKMHDHKSAVQCLQAFLGGGEASTQC